MPLWLILIIIGIVLIVAARYWIGDPQFSRWAYGGGVACIIIGALFLIAGLLGLAAPTAHAEVLSPMALGGGLMLGTLDTLHAAPSDPIAPKPWLTSRTLVVNGALTIVFALGLIGQLAGAFQIDPKWVALAGAGAAVINFYLRLDTSTPIAGTPAAAKVETAKEDIAIHAAVNAAVPEPGPLSVGELGRALDRVKKERDDRNALLDKAAQMASSSPATMPPSPSVQTVITSPTVTTP